ncbi:MAG TPA: hypothetical protein PLM60_10105 [Methanoregulaceae archaeon]|nr:hypothetical protein [Methanoregulaceae archaeon]
MAFISLITGLDDTILCLIGAIVLICAIAAALFTRKSRTTAQKKMQSITPEPFHVPLRVQKIPVKIREATPVPIAEPVSSSKDIDCLHGMTSLSESLVALAQKHALEEVTLATADGLLLASSGSAPNAENIARYCGVHKDSAWAQPDGIRMFDIEHRGSIIILMIKTSLPLMRESERALVQETKAILNWWI